MFGVLPKSNPLVMLVEDDGPVRRGIEAFLSSSGVTVVAGGNAGEALQAVAAIAAHPDVLVVNYWLGTEAAVDVVPQVQQALPSSLPVIVITGDTSLDVHEAVKSEGWSLLIKPFQPEELLAAIAQAVSRP